MLDETKPTIPNQEITRPPIVVDSEHPLTLLFTDGNIAFFTDSEGQHWTLLENRNELRPSLTLDAHPMNLQNLQTGKMPKIDPASAVRFDNLMDGGIYVKKVSYDNRLRVLQSLVKEKQSKLAQNPDDMESQEILTLAQEPIPIIQQFVETAEALLTATDDKAKAQLRASCLSIIETMEKPEQP